MGRGLCGSYDARQEALQAHLFGAKFTKVAPFAAPAAHSVAAELYEHQAAGHVQPSEENRLVFKARPGTGLGQLGAVPIHRRPCWLVEGRLHACPESNAEHSHAPASLQAWQGKHQ